MCSNKINPKVQWTGKDPEKSKKQPRSKHWKKNRQQQKKTNAENAKDRRTQWNSVKRQRRRRIN